MGTKKLRINCPGCDFFIDTNVEKDPNFFFIFSCPDCGHNVVYYNKKVDIISDELLNRLIDNDEISPHIFTVLDVPVINNDDIAHLKEALETTKTVDEFLRKV